MKALIHTLKTNIDFAQRIDHILSGDIAYTDMCHYDLHRQLSNQQPDSALICVALASLDLVCSIGEMNASFPSLPLLKIEAERVIGHYGSLWLQNALHENVEPEAALDLLMGVPEDLESLSSLLELCAETVGKTHELEPQIMDVLSKQAQAQSLIAEDFIDALSAFAGVEAKREETASYSNNVIAFPTAVVAQQARA